MILNIMWYSIVRLKVKWNQWFFFLHNALPIWEENGGLDYQLFFKAVRTFLIERSSTKIAQNSYSPFTKMTFACSESNFFQHPPSQIHIKNSEVITSPITFILIQPKTLCGKDTIRCRRSTFLHVHSSVWSSHRQFIQ